MPSYTRVKRRMTDAEIVADYQEWRDTYAVAYRAGVCTATVLAVLRRAGLGHLIPKRGPGNTGVYRPVGLPDDEIIKRYCDGESGPVIAKAAGCNPTSIYNRLRRAGIPRRASPIDRANRARAQAAARRRQEGTADG